MRVLLKKLHPKLLVLIAVLYVLTPIDLIPDQIPLLGSLDDAIVVLTMFLLKEKRRKSLEEK